MSGGHFDYAQYRIGDIVSAIEDLIASNHDKSLDEFGWERGCGYREATIERFREAAATLRKARAMAQRIDWLVSGDDQEETFHSRWNEEVEDTK